MNPPASSGPSPRRRGKFRLWIADQLIQPVPDEIAACEFDCEDPDCSPEEWRHCARRLQTLEEARRRGKPA